jgi:hypothetical protein
MSYILKIYPNDSLVIVIYQGKITLDELNETRSKIITHPDYSNDFNGVFDFRKATKIISTKDLQTLSETINNQKPAKGKWCSLNSTPYESALTEILKRKIDKTHPFEVFSSVEAASKYLDTPLSNYFNENNS